MARIFKASGETEKEVEKGGLFPGQAPAVPNLELSACLLSPCALCGPPPALGLQPGWLDLLDGTVTGAPMTNVL